MRAKLFCVLVLVLGGTVLIAGATSFPGVGGGAIPDGGPGCGVPAATTLDLTFTVSGEPAGAPTGVGVEMDITHSWVGDVTATLVAPDGTTSIPMFGNTGSTTATGCGDSSNLGAIYGFYDATPNATNWWDEATAQGGADIMTADNYRATEPGGAGQVNPAPFADIDAAFAGLADPNGVWTLRVNDSGGGDTGSVASARLFLDQPVPVELLSFSIE